MSDQAQRVPVISIDAAPAEIYARQTKGRHTSWRRIGAWMMQTAFYGLPWLSWNGRQAVLFDLAARKVYLFGLVLWPRDLGYLAILPVIFGFSLFLFISLAGSAWWSAARPPAVYTEILMWIECRIEGGRSARVGMDKQSRLEKSLARTIVKHVACGAFALWTGMTFVGYFTPISPLVIAIGEFAPGFSQAFWILLYGFATYANTGWVREQAAR
jgi:polyferredoxin